MRRMGFCVLALSGLWACSSGNTDVDTYEPLGGGYPLTSGSGDGGTGAVAVTSSSGETTTVTSTAMSSSSTGMLCPDDAEPNDDVGSAYDLGEITDADSSGGDFTGVIATGGDVDWFRYHGVDDVGSTVDPGRQITATGVEICKFIDCDSGRSNDFTCPAGTTPTIDGSLTGCCWNDNAAHAIDLTCGATGLDSDNATVYMRLQSDGTLSGCAAYVLNYHY
ncbi:MAG: hypothetical protein U0271_11995 [Polyangiaceae bacterium]